MATSPDSSLAQRRDRIAESRGAVAEGRVANGQPLSRGPEGIVIRGARQHNLQGISLTIPRNALVVVTGLSGSGKSSLAFDTIYAEGQRRYVESLSAYARQFLGQMEKPDVEAIEGLSPAISIDQKTTSRNPRSPWGPSPRSTTTCGCSGRGSASPTATSATGRSAASRLSRSSTRCLSCRRG